MFRDPNETRGYGHTVAPSPPRLEAGEAVHAPLRIAGWTIDVINRLAVDLFSDGLNADPNRPHDTVESF